MKAKLSITDSHVHFLLGIFLSILNAVLALPSLWSAWWHDLYAAGGFSAFLIWISSIVIASYRLRHLGWSRNTFWIVFSALLCIVGSMTSLRVCHHLALACALCGFITSTKQVWLLAVAALSWLPASGWLISRFSVGGIAGWERPILSTIASMVLLVCLCRNPIKSIK